MASVAQPQFDSRIEQIASSIRSLDITQLDIWNELDALSTHTSVEAVEVLDDGIVIEPQGRFSGVFNLYVILQYGRDEDEGFASSDSFLVDFRGHFVDGEPEIDHLNIDTSAFYE